MHKIHVCTHSDPPINKVVRIVGHFIFLNHYKNNSSYWNENFKDLLQKWWFKRGSVPRLRRRSRCTVSESSAEDPNMCISRRSKELGFSYGILYRIWKSLEVITHNKNFFCLLPSLVRRCDWTLLFWNQWRDCQCQFGAFWSYDNRLEQNVLWWHHMPHNTSESNLMPINL